MKQLAAAAPDQRSACGHLLRLAEAGTAAAERAELEAFIASRFARGHGATVSSFMPTLLSFRDTAGDLRGVIGLRGAGHGPLYLEQYLDGPIESSITALAGSAVERHEIVEVGNLAGWNCRAAMRMVALLPGYLLARDFRWIAFTATRAVRGILQAFGAPLLELASADASRLAHGADRWGSYYENDPRVLIGYLPASRRIPGFVAAMHDR